MNTHTKRFSVFSAATSACATNVDCSRPDSKAAGMQLFISLSSSVLFGCKTHLLRLQQVYFLFPFFWI